MDALTERPFLSHDLVYIIRIWMSTIWCIIVEGAIPETHSPIDSGLVACDLNRMEWLRLCLATVNQGGVASC